MADRQHPDVRLADAEERLRAALGAAAAAMTPGPDGWAAVRARTSATASRRRLGVTPPIAALVSALVIIVATVGVMVSRDDDGRRGGIPLQTDEGTATTGPTDP